MSQKGTNLARDVNRAHGSMALDSGASDGTICQVPGCRVRCGVRELYTLWETGKCAAQMKRDPVSRAAIRPIRERRWWRWPVVCDRKGAKDGPSDSLTQQSAKGSGWPV
jgi:hypothetical protein